MADSITTWRLTALASTQDGRIGATTTGIRVLQDFLIDLDLPLALTQVDLMYQISGSYYLPWEEVIANRVSIEPALVTIDVEYDRTELKVDDTMQVDVNVRLNKEGRAETADEGSL